MFNRLRGRGGGARATDPASGTRQLAPPPPSGPRAQPQADPSQPGQAPVDEKGNGAGDQFEDNYWIGQEPEDAFAAFMEGTYNLLVTNLETIQKMKPSQLNVKKTMLDSLNYIGPRGVDSVSVLCRSSIFNFKSSRGQALLGKQFVYGSHDDPKSELWSTVLSNPQRFHFYAEATDARDAEGLTLGRVSTVFGNWMAIQWFTQNYYLECSFDLLPPWMSPSVGGMLATLTLTEYAMQWCAREIQVRVASAAESGQARAVVDWRMYAQVRKWKGRKEWKVTLPPHPAYKGICLLTEMWCKNSVSKHPDIKTASRSPSADGVPVWKGNGGLEKTDFGRLDQTSSGLGTGDILKQDAQMALAIIFSYPGISCSMSSDPSEKQRLLIMETNEKLVGLCQETPFVATVQALMVKDYLVRAVYYFREETNLSTLATRIDQAGFVDGDDLAARLAQILADTMNTIKETVDTNAVDHDVDELWVRLKGSLAVVATGPVQIDNEGGAVTKAAVAGMVYNDERGAWEVPPQAPPDSS